jgi:very-short-patch-repair endonuclease
MRSSRLGNSPGRSAHPAGSRCRRTARAASSDDTEIAAQWDYEKNTLKPSDFAPYSNLRAGWKCKYGHRWETTILNRTYNLSGCPHCSGAQTSKIEIYLYCELKHIFKDVLLRKKVDGCEVDIQIPSIKVAIEVDGSYWHEKRTKRDREKNKVIKAAGLQLIRVRQDELQSITADEVYPIKTASHRSRL